MKKSDKRTEHEKRVDEQELAQGHAFDRRYDGAGEGRLGVSSQPDIRQPSMSFNEGLSFIVTLWKQRQAFRDMWWLPLVAFVPVLNLLLMRGWRLDIVRRMETGADRLVPAAENVPRYLKTGVVLWCMTFIYAIPEIILLVLFGTDVLNTLLAIGLWAYRSLFNPDQAGTLMALAAEIGWGVLAKLFVMSLYWVLAWPVYRAGMVNYAISGQVRAFFKIGTNIRIAYAHLGLYLQALLFNSLAQVLTTVGASVLALSGVLAPITPAVALPFFYAATAYYYGRLPAAVLQRVR